GYLTSPLASAAGLPGSCLTVKSELSGSTRPSLTTWASSERSSSEVKCTTCRRYGSPPLLCAVESALAVFSEMTSLRPIWACRPDAAMASDLRKSMMHPLRLSLADGELDQSEAARVERSHRLVIHLVRRHFQHLVFVGHGIAARADLVAAAAVGGKSRAAAALRRNMERAGAIERKRCDPHFMREIRRRQVAGAVVRRVGIGDVFRQNALALLMPLHALAQHRQDRNIGDRHAGSPVLTGQTLPAPCLMTG